MPDTLVTVLSSGDTRLVLESDENGWCQVALVLDGARSALGADMRANVYTRLASALRDDARHPVSGTIDGRGVRFVLSLFERHASLYVGDEPGRRVLYFQSAEGAFMAKVALSSEDVTRWSDQLCEVDP